MDRLRFIPPVNIGEFVGLSILLFCVHALFFYTEIPVRQGAYVLALATVIISLLSADFIQVARRWFGPIFLWGVVDGLVAQSSLMDFIAPIQEMSAMTRQDQLAYSIRAYFLLGLPGLGLFMLMGILGTVGKDRQPGI